MTYLKDSLDYASPLPTIPKELENKLKLSTSFPLNTHEAELLHISLIGIVTQMKYENNDFNNLSNATIILTKDGEFTLYQKEGDIGIGYHANLIVYCVQLWRDREYTDYNIMTVFLEELCHNYWNIEDEEIVKYKVLEVINRTLNVKLEFNDLYSPDWKSSYPNIYGNGEN